MFLPPIGGGDTRISMMLVFDAPSHVPVQDLLKQTHGMSCILLQIGKEG